MGLLQPSLATLKKNRANSFSFLYNTPGCIVFQECTSSSHPWVLNNPPKFLKCPPFIIHDPNNCIARILRRNNIISAHQSVFSRDTISRCNFASAKTRHIFPAGSLSNIHKSPNHYIVQNSRSSCKNLALPVVPEKVPRNK